MKTQGSICMTKFPISLFLCGIVMIWSSHVFSQERKAFYDEESGIYWQWDGNSSGTGISRGWNKKTGTKWKTIIEPNGDKYGYSTFLGYWQYEKGSGFSFLSDNNLEDLRILLQKGLITKKEYKKKKAKLLK